ncbi:DUF421 domain-containing protein [Niameybacter massiliensis]|uniref:DUF421 domain-containing protein n=1 Tax=Niameybacter massiliensis TaxID=1658108 RepID=UPI0006B4EA52|nr:YetF domain-containing protein [Niameybacter massiliensis]
MEIPFLLKPIILFVVAVFLLRLTGRRSIAQMTIAQTVMIISIGAIIVEPFADKDIKKTIATATIYILLLIIFEVASFYMKWFKKLAVGNKIIIIQDGKFDEAKLKKLRLTKEEVLSRLRQEGIPKLEYVEEGTLESNGEFGFRLTPGAEPLRVQDMVYILNEVLSEDIKNRVNLTAEEIIKGKEKYKI